MNKDTKIEEFKSKWYQKAVNGLENDEISLLKVIEKDKKFEKLKKFVDALNEMIDNDDEIEDPYLIIEVKETVLNGLNDIIDNINEYRNIYNTIINSLNEENQIYINKILNELNLYSCATFLRVLNTRIKDPSQQNNLLNSWRENKYNAEDIEKKLNIVESMRISEKGGSSKTKSYHKKSLKRKSLKRKSLKRKSLKRKSLKKKSLKIRKTIVEK